MLTLQSPLVSPAGLSRTLPGNVIVLSTRFARLSPGQQPRLTTLAVTTYFPGAKPPAVQLTVTWAVWPVRTRLVFEATIVPLRLILTSRLSLKSPVLETLALKIRVWPTRRFVV